MSIRRARTTEEVDSACVIVNKYVQAYNSLIFPINKRVFLKEMLLGNLYVACVDERVIGTFVIKHLDKNNHPYIAHICVDVFCNIHGLLRSMMTYAEHLMVLQGYNDIIIEVSFSDKWFIDYCLSLSYKKASYQCNHTNTLLLQKNIHEYSCQNTNQ